MADVQYRRTHLSRTYDEIIVSLRLFIISDTDMPTKCSVGGAGWDYSKFVELSI